MAHHRKVIRDAVVTALTGLATTGSSVYPTRTYPLDEAKLPALCVYTISEDSAVDSMKVSTRGLRRSLELAVEGIAVNNGALDEALDQIALEVETAIGADPTFAGKCYDCTLSQTRISVRGGESQKEIGSVVMTFAVTYRTKASDPSTNAI